MPLSPPILARGLVKRFGDLLAVDHLDLSVEAGVCLGLLGPNGAGKTTTIEMLEGLGQPDSGEIHILGMSWHGHGRQIRERIGVQLQETILQEKLTVEETLRLYRSFYRQGRSLDAVMDLVGLQEKRRARVGQLSGGQRQRLALGCALINHPEVLFLDEPTTGLDPQARRRMWSIVEEFKREGGTVLLTTHYMEEAERLADAVMIMDRGRVIAQGTPAGLVASLRADSVVEFRPAAGQDGRPCPLPPGFLEALPGIGETQQVSGTVTVSVVDTPAAILGLLERARAEGLSLDTLHTHRPTLEDVFVHLTGRHLRDE